MSTAIWPAALFSSSYSGDMMSVFSPCGGSFMTIVYPSGMLYMPSFVGYRYFSVL